MKKIAVFLMVWTVACSLWAVPARRNGVTRQQPDGSTITVYTHSDEYFRWLTNEKGEWIEDGTDGFFRIIPAMTNEEIATIRVNHPRRISTKKFAPSPLNIAPKGLVILVNFKDLSFKTPSEEMDSMHNGANYTRKYEYQHRNQTFSIESQGSVKQYFRETSFGAYDPIFDVVGPVTVGQNMSYYGKNEGNFDNAPWEMIKEACQLVNNQYDIDFTKYDNDKDGYVDFVYVIYAGYGEADGAPANTIWPHSYTLIDAGVTCKVDGVTVNLYACGNELDYYSKFHTGIGTFCHEFSHVLGLPDLYVTNTAGHTTLNEWDIMDYGTYNNDSNTPPTYSAYERFFMGWLTPRLITNPENVVLKDLNKTNEALLITTTDEHNMIGNDPSPTTFYLLENRQQEGWDTYLAGHGLMLTKIQYSYQKWGQNTVNNTERKMGVDLIEADGQTSDRGKATDLFPAGATEYTTIENHQITDITETNGVIRFKYKGGNEETAIESIYCTAPIIAIYNSLGQKQSTILEELTTGTYIVVTSEGNYKIVR